MKKEQSINKFVKGIQLDLNPLTITADTLTDCLNGTCLTYNGNEYVLQNEMGNARVETAMLPAGYIPIGSTSFGGIIYILSHNPIEGKYQIGSFPSPERNLTKDELDDSSNSIINLAFDINSLKNNPDEGRKNNINQNLHQLILCNEEINSGDKFKVYSEELLNYLEENIISGYDTNNEQFNSNLYPKYIKIDLVSVLSNGSIVKLTEGLTWTKFEFETETDTGTKTSNGNFYIYPDKIINEKGKVSLKEYRNMINSQYDVYTNKIPGKLGVMLTYEAPNTFDISYDIIPPEKYGIKDFKFSGIHGNGSHTLFENLNLEKGEKIKIVINKHQYTDIDQGYIYIRLSKNDHSNFDDSREFPLFGSPNTEQTELVLNNFIPQQSSAISVTIVKDINSLYSSINTLPDDSIVSIGNIYYVIVSDEGGKKPIQIDKVSSREQIDDKIKDGTINSGDYIEIVDDIGDGEIQTGIYQITYEKGDDPNVVKYELVNVVAGSKVPSYGNTSGNEGNEGDGEGDGEEDNPEEDNIITQVDKWEQEIIVPETYSNARLIVGYTDIPEGTDLHLVNVQIIKYSAKMYYYLNWSNENIGEHKNRVNFQGINIDEQFYPIINKTSADTYISPDARENLDYYAPKLPDDYNQLNFDIVKYLNKWNDIYSIKQDGDLFLNTYRKNDGTDYQIVVKGNHLTYDLEKIKSEEESAIRKLTITPYMPYGKLSYLSKEISIDVTKIGTNTVDMNIFKYYKDDEKINLYLWFESYLDTNNRIKGIEVILHRFDNSESFKYASEISGQKADYNTYKEKLRPFINDGSVIKAYEHEIIQQSYNGSINHKIYFDEEFKENMIYQLEIVIKLSRNNQCIYFHRILHASNIFNDKYNSEVSDFKDLYMYEDQIENLNVLFDSDKLQFELKDSTYNIPQSSDTPSSDEIGKSNHTFQATNSLEVEDIKFELPLYADYNITRNSNLTLGKKFELLNDNKDISINNNDNLVTINYHTEYSDQKELPLYEMKPIEINSRFVCKLKLDGGREYGGNFVLQLGDGPNEQILYIEDGSDRKGSIGTYDMFSNDWVQQRLVQYMDDNHLDILLVDIGAILIKNSNWGFMFREPAEIDTNGNITKYSSWNQNPSHYSESTGYPKYGRFLFIRSYDDSRTLGYFIGTRIVRKIPSGDNDWNYIKKSGEYLSMLWKQNIRTISEYTYNDKVNFQKYQQVDTKTIYVLSINDYPRDPNIEGKFTITLSSSGNIIKDLNSKINNLSFSNITSITNSLSKYETIYNRNYINSISSWKDSDEAYDTDGKIISLKEVKYYFGKKSDGSSVSMDHSYDVSINDEGFLVLSSRHKQSKDGHFYDTLYTFDLKIRWENYTNNEQWDTKDEGQELQLLNFKLYNILEKDM